MNTTIKTKLLLIMLLTLTVAIGGSILYGDFLKKSSYDLALMNEGTLIVTSPKIQKPGELPSFDKNSPKYKPSLKKSYDQSFSTLDKDLTGNKSIFASSGSSDRSSLTTSARYNSYKQKDKDGIYTSSPMLLSQYQAGGRSKSTSSSAGGYGSTSAYSSGMNHFTGPLLAPGDAFANNGAPDDGNTNDPSDDFMPPEGAPVGNGFWLMMFFAGIYILIKRLKNSHLTQ